METCVCLGAEKGCARALAERILGLASRTSLFLAQWFYITCWNPNSCLLAANRAQEGYSSSSFTTPLPPFRRFAFSLDSLFLRLLLLLMNIRVMLILVSSRKILRCGSQVTYKKGVGINFWRLGQTLLFCKSIFSEQYCKTSPYSGIQSDNAGTWKSMQ